MKSSLFSLLIAVPLTFSWQAGDGLQRGFKLYWGTGGTVWESSKDVGNVLQFGDTFDFGAKPQLCFSVSSINSIGESAKSSQVCLKAPSAPFSLKQIN